MKKLAFLLVVGFVGFCANADVSIMALGPDGEACTGPGCGNDYPNGGDVNKYCEENNLSEKASCPSKGAKTAVCQKNHSDIDNKDHLSCTAKECDSSNGWLLWFHKKGNEYVPYGVCREKSYLQRTYCDDDCGCPQDGHNYKCIVKERDMPAKYYRQGLRGKVFFDKDLCECVATSEPEPTDECAGLQGKEWECCKAKTVKHQPVHWDKNANNGAGACLCENNKEYDWINEKCPDGDGGNVTPDNKQCVYYFDGEIECNGVKIKYEKKEPISREMVASLKLGNCEDQKIIDEKIKADKHYFDSLQAKWCKEIKPQNDDSKLKAAVSSMEAFFVTAEARPNVWKNAEGKFNTARLASDATAGVVLGTVGGIVSAKIIKKKQLEKGYDALNCTVGGQKVADYGDEFSVGMRR